MKRREFLVGASLAISAGSLWFPKNLVAGGVEQIRGRSYYLDSVKGDDSATGTSESTAWKSLAKLNNTTFQAGDHIFLRKGSKFAGQLKPKGLGAAGRPIVVDSYGDGDNPLINAYGGADSAVYLYNVEYWVLKNLRISNNGPRVSGGRAGVYINSEDFGVARGIVLQDLEIFGVNGSLVKKQGGGAGIIVNATGKKKATYYDGLTITGCKITDTARNGIMFLAAGDRRGSLGKNVVVSHNIVSKVPGDCILIAGCDGALIEHNNVSDCTDLPAGEAAAGIWPFNSDNTVIQYNEVSGHKAHADGEAFDADLECRNTIIQYNYSHDNIGGLALICNRGSAAGAVGNAGTVIRYNLSINDALRASGAASVRVTGPVTDSQVYNNIIIVPERGNGSRQSDVFKADNWVGQPSGTAIHDNIVVSTDAMTVDFKLGQRTTMARNLSFGRAAAVRAPQQEQGVVAQAAAGAGAEVLAKYRSYRPTLAEAVALVKRCFKGGVAVPDALSILGGQ